MDEFVPVRSGKLRSILSEPWKLRRASAVSIARPTKARKPTGCCTGTASHSSAETNCPNLGFGWHLRQQASARPRVDIADSHWQVALILKSTGIRHSLRPTNPSMYQDHLRVGSYWEDYSSDYYHQPDN